MAQQAVVKEEDKYQVLVCGAGNGAHAFAALAAANPKFKTIWLSTFMDDADRINKELEKQPLKIVYQEKEYDSVEGKPFLVTKDPSKAIPGSDIIVVCVPAFAHRGYFELFGKYLDKKNVIISVFPGKGGITFEFLSMLKNNNLSLKDYTLLNCNTLPWACRINTFGKEVFILGVKDDIDMIEFGNSETKSLEKLQSWLGQKPKLRTDPKEHILSFALSTSVVHPSTMYCKWKDWDDEKSEALDEKPLFYQGVTEESANVLSTLSDECVAIGDALNKLVNADTRQKDIKVVHVKQWYINLYSTQLPDKSSLYAILKYNPAYNGLAHPMVEIKDENDPNAKPKYKPMFNYRYLTEDIPFGLLPTKGCALLANVKTPTMDAIIRWAQKKIGKEYIDDDGNLTGKDVAQSRAPQAYGFDTLEKAFNAMKV